MGQPQEIAIAFPRGAHQEIFMDGLLQYASDHQRYWTYVTAPESLQLSILELRDWDGDGVLAALNTAEEAAASAELAIPVINISSSLVESPVPRVNVDNRLIGELAAGHLIERGFRSFAFFGLKDVAYSKQRQSGFNQRLATSSFESHALLSTATFALLGTFWQQQTRELAEWMRELPTPIALFAVTDYRARQVLDVCNHLGLRVPQDVAVLGVDNEEVLCRHIRPQLSSVARNNHLEGYRAAALLDRLMHGETSVENESITPTGVIERESTKVIAVSDVRVRKAVDFVNQHLRDAFDVNKIAVHVGVSRRWLEYAFRSELGESPYQFVRRQRLEQARKLLEEEPSMKVRQIADETGFSSAKQLTMTFCECFGKSPRDYRKAVLEELPNGGSPSAYQPRVRREQAG